MEEYWRSQTGSLWRGTQTVLKTAYLKWEFGVHPVSQVKRLSGVVRRVLMGYTVLVNRLLAVSVSGHAQWKTSGSNIPLKAFCSLLLPTTLKGKPPTGVVQQGSGQGQWVQWQCSPMVWGICPFPSAPTVFPPLISGSRFRDYSNQSAKCGKAVIRKEIQWFHILKTHALLVIQSCLCLPSLRAMWMSWGVTSGYC